VLLEGGGEYLSSSPKGEREGRKGREPCTRELPVVPGSKGAAGRVPARRRAGPHFPARKEKPGKKTMIDCVQSRREIVFEDR